MLTLHFGGLNAILFIGQLPIFGWFSCWISTQGLDLALRYQYVYRHRETWKQKSPSAEVVKAGEEHFRIRNFFFHRRCWWIKPKPKPKFKDDAQYCSKVAAFLGHMTCWDCCLVLWICPEQMVLDPAQSFDNVYRNVTKLSGESACVGHICFGESCCFPMDETQTCTKCPTCPEQLK